MKDVRDNIKQPHLSEKTSDPKRLPKYNIYTFIVHKNINKNEIKRSVETIYGVKVAKVRTLIMKGKRKKMRNMAQFGRRKDWKKAYVRLKEGYRLDII